MWPFSIIKKRKKNNYLILETAKWQALRITGQRITMYFKEFPSNKIPEKYCYLYEFYGDCNKCEIITQCQDVGQKYREARTKESRKQYAKELQTLIGGLKC